MAETPVTSAMHMDRSEPLGNSVDEYGRRALHSKVSGKVGIRGATVSALVTIVTVNQANWFPLPATVLTDRNTVLIQNQSTTVTVRLNFSNAAPASEGIQLAPGAAFEILLSNGLAIYGRAVAPGAAQLAVMELA